MTEAEWEACLNPEAMLEFLDGKVSPRKLRLFACACCRRLPFPRAIADLSHAALAEGERFADGGPWEALADARRDLAEVDDHHREATAVRWATSTIGISIDDARECATCTRHVAGGPITL